ncbi:MAG: GntR family transcriptional regulator [Solirubrobacteraceae bacterium]|nr:GntR family transcriptional regulator [Solirubrobacteraceae bacterium]
MSTAEPTPATAQEEPLSSTDPGLVDDLADRIHTRVLTGEYAVGTWLRQEALAAEFGVSRTPVREALRKLQAARVVDVFPHRGALVRAPTATDIREAHLIRGELEGLAAEMATQRIDDDGLRQLREAEEAFRQAVPQLKDLVKKSGVSAIADGPWDSANLRFHRAILDASGIARLGPLVADLRKAFPRNVAWAALADEPSLLEDDVTQHARIRAAIERRDAPAARRWMTDHCRRTGELVADWFERTYTGDTANADPDDRAAKRREALTRP